MAGLNIPLTIMLVISSASSLLSQQAPCVKTTTGQLCGFNAYFSETGTNFSLYFGIPYAEPPIGDNRFLPPKAKVPWQGTFHADGLVTPLCAQPDTSIHNSTVQIGQEDCLFMNIYVPLQNSKTGIEDTARPVMFFIHGGAYYFGGASVYDGRTLASYGNVIMVIINYRLGPFGFGYLPLTKMRGNMGLLDQRMALQWVSDNIAQFGGDPDQITIFGESAGAGSVSAHLASDKSRNLFRNAITESGSILCQWALKSKIFMGELTTLFAGYAGCFKLNQPDFKLPFDCLKEKSTLELLEAHAELMKKVTGMFLSPVNDDALFFGGDAYDLQQKANYNGRTILVGTNYDEGASFLLALAPKIFKEYQAMTETDYFTNGLELVKMVPSITQFVVLNYYRPPRNTDYFRSIEQLVSDLFIGCCGGQEAVKPYVPTADKSFMYLFNQTTDFTHIDIELGAYHSVELQFVFGNILYKSTATDAEKQLSRIMMTYWTNIAKIGKPAISEVDWPPISKTKPHSGAVQLPFKLLRADSQPVIYNHKLEECTFWQNFDPFIPNDARNYIYSN